MSRIYLIDSENVGDHWISLLENITDEDEILVFYTNKSPHMNYRNVILLKQTMKKVSFIECCEGCNALDFQLCTELGYLIHELVDREFTIVSNDTGYDAVIHYWRKKNIKIRRIQGKECIRESIKEVEEEKLLPVPVRENGPEEHTFIHSEIDQRAKEILYVIGKENLQMLHEALRQIFGSQKGMQFYNTFKSDAAYANDIAKHESLSVERKQELYCSIVFELSEQSLELPKDFPQFAIAAWRKKNNLNSFRASLQGKYGKNLSDVYYSIIKPHVKILDKIK